MVVIGAIVFVLVAVLGGGGYWYFTQNSASATSAAWDAVDRNDADELRAFIAGDPGASRAEAEQALPIWKSVRLKRRAIPIRLKRSKRS